MIPKRTAHKRHACHASSSSIFTSSNSIFPHRQTNEQANQNGPNDRQMQTQKPHVHSAHASVSLHPQELHSTGVCNMSQTYSHIPNLQDYTPLPQSRPLALAGHRQVFTISLSSILVLSSGRCKITKRARLTPRTQPHNPQATC